tara:strand:- start:5 stop:202 length:198 start_codon:yes stop_codon:yes gene_type:complete
MESYKREGYLKCPHCNEELGMDTAEDHAVCEGPSKGLIEIHECYECYLPFAVQYNEITNMIDVAI